MVGCSAYGCTNRSEKGFLMKKFPKEPIRRSLWAAKVKRENWKPTNSSVLCEVHFDETMWEKTREDGSRKLKMNAIPTIFSFVPPKKARKPPAKRTFQAPKDVIVVPSCTEENVAQPELEPVAGPSNMDNSGSSLKDIETSLEAINSVEQSDTALSLKNEQYDKIYKKMMTQLNKYKQKVTSLKKNQHAITQEAVLLRKVFNEDQIKALKRKSTKFMKWSNTTIQSSLKLKFSCGNNGYLELLRQNMPLPSLRTLRRRMQNLKFDSGILYEVFQFLRIKVKTFSSEHQKDCAILLDEMAITPANVYDTSLKKFFGNVTLPGHSGVATHALVIMLGGISSRWKQTVAYYFTSDSVNGAIYENILFEVIQKAEEIGCNVISITSDMGASNRALWRKWNITAGRYSQTNNFIIHPLDPNRKIYILADVPHLFKNIKNTLINNKIIKISESVQMSHNLPTNIINANHIQELVNYQDKLRFKLAPKLTQEDIIPSHFHTMRVSTSTHVVSHDVSSGLKFLSEELEKPEFITTAWFIDLIEEWFTIMTSRHPTNALSKKNMKIYMDTITFLEKFKQIYSSLEIGEKGYWKPTQTGALISTESILAIQNLYLHQKNFEFLLTSRFTQDCLENLFSIVRSKQVIPNASQFKNNLKLISVSQYLKDVSKGSYDEDDRKFLSEFLDIVQEEQLFDSHATMLSNVVQEEYVPKLCFSERNSLYNICGYIVSSIKKTTRVCQKCIDSVGSKTYDKSLKYAKLTHLKCFKKGTMFFCNDLTFLYFCKLEDIFITYWNNVKDEKINIKEFYINKMQNIDCYHITTCHNLKKHIVNRFVSFRLKIASKKKLGFTKKQSSKSMAMHNI